ncbi:N-acetylmuramoyl-L-alanine amidase [Calothrix sp. 336/3]|uniref:N-acetylmuramoyl-L-alanine amidase n=1 Tax=Calothrix sp. 336/3 TaxID=1337936 RepID=UPI0004E3D272|nr:N-acetylmuramoyl-L-alanine amidase [Calothrix sp. 336/3]AKG21031.1 N-acetylmuramoyl-L-alanine amidase [Calothrix sp. 336/3]
MKSLLGFISLSSIVVPSVAMANEQSLKVVFPKNNYQTSADRIFFIGTAPPTGQVLVNGKPITRSLGGHFAPNFPLNLGENLFTFRYENQEVQIKVIRVANQPEIPQGLGFAPDSLIPAVDIARLPGEVVCFSAIATPSAKVSVKLANQTIILSPQPQQVQLPSNLAALTGTSQSTDQLRTTKYAGCMELTPEVTQNVSTLIYGNNIISGAVLPDNTKDMDLGKPEFQLTLNGKTLTQEGKGKVQILAPAKLPVIEVTADGGVARTGSSTDYSRLTPLPQGTRATVTGKDGDWLRLDYGGWINSKETITIPGAIPPKAIIRSVTSRQLPRATEIIFPLQTTVPLTVEQGSRTFTLNLYNTTAQTDIIRLDDNPLISRLDWQQVTPQQTRYTFHLKKDQQWGYKLRYQGSNLILTLRHAPAIAKDKPLTGTKILLDPGHGGNESGAAGPTGYLEKDVNLIVSKLLRDELVKRGATVVMTRDTDKEVSLPDRQKIIHQEEPTLALSIHYNSLPDNGDAENTRGIGTFWYHPQAHSLAIFMHNYLVKELNRPSYGVFWNNLALARPSAAPSVLLELGFMSNPQEFEWVTDEKQQKKLAQAIAQGVVQWLQKSTK